MAPAGTEGRGISWALRILEKRPRAGPSLSEAATYGAFFRLRLSNEEREHFEAAFPNIPCQLIAVDRLLSSTIDMGSSTAPWSSRLWP